MHFNKRTLFVSAVAILAISIVRSKINMKLTKDTDRAIENGKLLTEKPCRVLAISAHPDDLEFFAGGLLKKMKSVGHDIHIIDVTDGEKGTRIRNLAQIRRFEQLKAGSILDIDNIDFLQLPDLRLSQIENLDSIFKEHIEKIIPDIVLTFDYFKPIRAIKHPDHIMVGRSTKKAVEQLEYKKPILIYYASREPNSVVDISTSIEDKIKAVQAHRSQIRFSGKPYAYLIRAFARYCSNNTNLKYVESFRMEK